MFVQFKYISWKDLYFEFQKIIPDKDEPKVFYRI